jgi:hypothetical protein
MCPPAASSASFGELGPVVPPSAWRVISSCELPVAAVGRAYLVMIDSASGLNRGRWSWFGESAGQWHRQWQWCGWLWGEGAFSSFGSLAGQSAQASAVATILVGHVGVVDGAMVPVVGVPLGQDAVGVVAVDMRSRTLTTPMAHSQAVEAEPLCCHIRTHHVAWTTPSDDNCRWAVDGT